MLGALTEWNDEAMAAAGPASPDPSPEHISRSRAAGHLKPLYRFGAMLLQFVGCGREHKTVGLRAQGLGVLLVCGAVVLQAKVRHGFRES